MPKKGKKNFLKFEADNIESITAKKQDLTQNPSHTKKSQQSGKSRGNRTVNTRENNASVDQPTPVGNFHEVDQQKLLFWSTNTSESPDLIPDISTNDATQTSFNPSITENQRGVWGKPRPSLPIEESEGRGGSPSETYYKTNSSFDRTSQNFPQDDQSNVPFQRNVTSNWRDRGESKPDNHNSYQGMTKAGTSHRKNGNKNSNFNGKGENSFDTASADGGSNRFSKLSITEKRDSNFKKSYTKDDQIPQNFDSDFYKPVLPRYIDDDYEYKEFYKLEKEGRDRGKYEKVTEIDKDIFQMSEEYSLGHCVAADLRMGSGIAVGFKKKFGKLAELLSQYKKPGELAVLESKTECGKRYVYYLVTKYLSNEKPTYGDFWRSLKELRTHVRDNAVKKLALPRIGCGLDRLEWETVKFMIEFLFQDVDVEIVVCNYQQDENATPQKDNTCKVVFHEKPIIEIATYTIIIYFATEQGDFEEDVLDLNRKFNFLDAFKRESKTLGQVIRYDKRKSYILYGCIVRRTRKDRFDFNSFAKCLTTIKKNNQKDLFEYVAYQRIQDERDRVINEKIITLLRNILRDVDVYICNMRQTWS